MYRERDRQIRTCRSFRERNLQCMVKKSFKIIHYYLSAACTMYSVKPAHKTNLTCNGFIHNRCTKSPACSSTSWMPISGRFRKVVFSKLSVICNTVTH